MKIMNVVGARPQFIKAAAMSRALRLKHEEVLVHTGQHYDQNMSEVFFRDLEIPSPDYNLGVGSGLQGWQTAEILQRIERVMLLERPDWVLVYGDTNSTFGAGLGAVKLHLKLAHIEAGLRSWNRSMPEEINRILTDHVSDLLFCPTESAVSNLASEGITRGVHLVGDVMADALAFAAQRATAVSDILPRIGVRERNYFVATVHRAENTDDPSRLKNIVSAFRSLDQVVVFPVHPRTRKALTSLSLEDPGNTNVRLIDPVSYLDMVCLLRSTRLVLTDSGGLQKEAFWLGVPCVVLRDETEWVEMVRPESNVLAGSEPRRILEAVNSLLSLPSRSSGETKLGKSDHSAERCIDLLEAPALT